MKYLKKFSNKRALIIHGYNTNSSECFYPWLKNELEKIGYHVDLPNLPNATNPDLNEQIEYISSLNGRYDLILGHSFGTCVAMKLVEGLDYKIDQLLLVSGFIDCNFNEGDEDADILKNAFNWEFDFNKIRSNCKSIYILRPNIDTEITLLQTKSLSKSLGVHINYFKQVEDHACGIEEPEILKFIEKVI